jgi:hypothetical protein
MHLSVYLPNSLSDQKSFVTKITLTNEPFYFILLEKTFYHVLFFVFVEQTLLYFDFCVEGFLSWGRTAHVAFSLDSYRNLYSSGIKGCDWELLEDKATVHLFWVLFICMGLICDRLSLDHCSHYL